VPLISIQVHEIEEIPMSKTNAAAQSLFELLIQMFQIRILPKP